MSTDEKHNMSPYSSWDVIQVSIQIWNSLPPWARRCQKSQFWLNFPFKDQAINVTYVQSAYKNNPHSIPQLRHVTEHPAVFSIAANSVHWANTVISFVSLRCLSIQRALSRLQIKTKKVIQSEACSAIINCNSLISVIRII